MRRSVFVIAALLVALGACAPVPIPTASLVTPTRSPSPSTTAMPTSTETPTLTATPTEVTPTAAMTVSPTATPFSYEKNPRALLIEADVSGGGAIAPVDMHVPRWRLYGDGLVVFAADRAPLSSGLDAVVRVGHLSEAQIQSLLAYLSQVGFFSLEDAYKPRPEPRDAPIARISVYLTKAKTVRVHAPGSEGTPQSFSDAMLRITQTLPADAEIVTSTSAYLESTFAGPVSTFGTKDTLNEWSVTGARLADAVDGVTISGSTYAQASALIASALPSTLFREGDRVYRVRFAPDLPRSVHLSDWSGTILEAPREFEGRMVDIVGYFRGWNLFGEAEGNPPVTRNDWVVADATGAIYVTGAAPPGLDPSSRADAWSVVRLTARVVYVRLGTSHLEARRVQVLARSAPTATPTIVPPITTTMPETATAAASITPTQSATPAASVALTRTLTATVAP